VWNTNRLQRNSQQQGSRKLERVGKIIRPREGIRAAAGGGLQSVPTKSMKQITFKTKKNGKKNPHFNLIRKQFIGNSTR
jgi:hypothetical protein